MLTFPCVLRKERERKKKVTYEKQKMRCNYLE